jgi:nucleotide-binding universal stress UspA family protein
MHYNFSMYRRILAAVNEYTNAEVAAHYAITLAKSCSAKLSLIFISKPGLPRAVLKNAESALGRLFVEASDQGVEVESLTETGDPFGKIYDVVRREGIDMVFTATRREDVKKRFFQKTLGRELMVRFPCSVAMVRVVRMGRVHPRHILVPVRGRMKSIEERACFVAELARGFGAEVTMFHTPRPITSFFHGDIHLTSAEREGRIPRDIEEFTRCLNRHMVRHEKRTAYGGVSRAITVEAVRRRNDLIVMGASERGAVRSIVGGNPVEEVLRETPCNLIILRPGRK